MNLLKPFVMLTLLIFALAVTFNSEADSRDLKILGWVEQVNLLAPRIPLKAKLDTGAETSSLDARIIKKFRKGGKRWVRFQLTDRETGEEFVLVRERVRTIGVVQHDGSSQSRPVVVMEFCLAGKVLQTEVSLIDRSEFIYPMLLGRKTIGSFALVDSAHTFLSSPDCDSGPVDPGPAP
jgi:hypothetical protein